MINLVTLEQATINCPAIDCSMPSIKVSDRYKLISTKNLLHNAINDGWKIFDTYQVGKKVTAEHYVLMTHDAILNNESIMQQGFPFVCVVNSHDGKQRFKYILGYKSFDFKTTIFTEDVYMEDSYINHRKHTDEEVFAKLNNTKIYFKSFLDGIDTFKGKVLSENDFEILISFYKKYIKKKIQIEYSLDNNLWNISNEIHKLLGKSISQNIKISQKFWLAMCSSLILADDDLKGFLIDK